MKLSRKSICYIMAVVTVIMLSFFIYDDMQQQQQHHSPENKTIACVVVLYQDGTGGCITNLTLQPQQGKIVHDIARRNFAEDW